MRSALLVAFFFLAAVVLLLFVVIDRMADPIAEYIGERQAGHAIPQR